MTMKFDHTPVMFRQVMQYFASCRGKIIVDATAGGGGHLAMLARLVGEDGHVFAFDRDLRAHQEDAALGVQALFAKTVTLFHRPFSAISSTLSSMGISKIDGLLCDLGVSSNQLDDASRGFSFSHDGPIDMRMDQSQGKSAYEWLATSSEKTIADAIFNFGGERKSRAIASAIKKAWPIENSTLELAKLVVKAMRQKSWSKTHPATRTFQALRIAVNGELDELACLLNDVPKLLAPAGVAVFLSFHSLEDRLIKHAFRALGHKDYHDDENRKFAILTKRPEVADELELATNYRARSAKLRALARVL